MTGPARETETRAEVWLTIDTPRWRRTRFRISAASPWRGPVRERPSTSAPTTAIRCGSTSIPRASPRRPIAELAELLAGGSGLSVTAAEPVAAWELLDPGLDSWRQGTVPLEEYPAGTDVSGD
jgi:glucose-6-phosphate 1-dehydrogenase